MRALAISAFVLDGVASVGFVAMMALGEGRMTPLDAFILSALLLGFFSALGSLVLSETGTLPPDETAELILTGAAIFDRLPDPAKRNLRLHFPAAPTAESEADPTADPADHLALLTQPFVDAGLGSSRVQ